MSETKRANPTFVVAIDFGTCRSGYGFASKERPDEIVWEQRWGSGGSPSLKTRTAILLREDLSVHSFGEQARMRYLETEPREREKLLFFDHFKMCLYGDNWHKAPFIKAANGKKVEAVTVFAAALRYIKGHAMGRLKEATSGVVEDTDVLWVLTVPAIWSPAAKQLMREAATLAGLCGYAEQFVLALEPEAASLCCRKRETNLKVGDQYLVVDGGGGTVDSTVHRILKDRSLFEVCVSSGGDWGSTQIDAEFVRLLEAIFGADTIGEFREKHVLPWIELMSEFERVKHTLSPHEGIWRCLSIPAAFDHYISAKGNNIQWFVDRFYSRGEESKTIPSEEKLPAVAVKKEEEKKEEKEEKEEPGCEEWEQISSGVEVSAPASGGVSKSSGASSSSSSSTTTTLTSSKTDLPLRYDGTYLRLSHSLCLSLFAPTVARIVAHLREILGRVGPCNYVFLAGGFAESEVVYEAIRSTLHALEICKNTRVLRPHHASLAILTGAVIFGLNQKVISSRVIKHTYGMSCAERWNESKHVAAKRKQQFVLREGCRVPFTFGYFHSFVTAGQEMKVDNCVTHTFTPLEDGQRTLVVAIYASHEKKVDYIEDVGCEKVGSMTVQLPPPPASLRAALQREVQVQMKFGDTEITVTATDRSTNTACVTTLSFLDHS